MPASANCAASRTDIATGVFDSGAGARWAVTVTSGICACALPHSSDSASKWGAPGAWSFFIRAAKEMPNPEV
jgi:hypothetical protein